MAQILQRVPAAGTHAPLGKLRFAGRQRPCNELTGCLSWTESDHAPVSFPEQYGLSREHTTTGSVSLPLPYERNVGIDLTVLPNHDFAPHLTSMLWTEKSSDGWLFELNAKTGLVFDDFSGAYFYQSGSMGPTAGAFVIGDMSYPAGTDAPPTKRAFDGAVLTNECFWVKAGGRAYGANRSYVEYEVTLSGRF